MNLSATISMVHKHNDQWGLRFISRFTKADFSTIARTTNALQSSIVITDVESLLQKQTAQS